MIELYTSDNTKVCEAPNHDEEELLKEAFQTGGYCRQREFGDDDSDLFCPVVLK